jgi:hypothetical protein
LGSHENLAAIFLVLVGASVAVAQGVPKLQPMEKPSQPRSILPPQTSAEKMMRQLILKGTDQQKSVTKLAEAA